MPFTSVANLKNDIFSILKRQGYSIKPNGVFILKSEEHEKKRKAHELAKAERVNKNEQFLLEKIPIIEKYIIDGKNLDISKIEPEIIEIESGSKEEDFFRWWNIVWWSLPYEHAYGRQMRFIVWDKYHNAPIGLIGLQSPILSWSARDKYLGIKIKKRDFWVNQSLSAQRIGALPPYNDIRGGKLVAMLMTSKDIQERFEKKYKKQKTLLLGRKLPSNLLFITTTGAYGKSSVYNRLKFKDEIVSKFIGYTQGSGTFHIPNALYEDLIVYLKKRGFDTERGYGNGPSRKLRLIDQALQLLGLENGIIHGIKRAVYIFPLATNLKEVIQAEEKPIWYNREIEEMTLFWKNRWALPYSERNKIYQEFSKEEFIEKTKKDLKKYKRICNNI
jgi:hypothetical protein